MRCAVSVIVILSVCTSDTLVDCLHGSTYTIMVSSPYGSPMFLEISGSSWKSKGVAPSEGVEWEWGGYELAIFDQ